MNTKQKRELNLLAIAGAAIVLAGCGGGSDPVAPTPEPTPPPAATAVACADLNGRVISADKIGLPTTGAVVTAATTVAAAGTGATAVGEYCKVFGDIKPVDPTAPPIKFQLNLPTAWNQKSMQIGGGGFEGLLVGALTSGALNVPNAAATALSPLSRGYATYGSDSGHAADPAVGNKSAIFALNDEALTNQTGAAYKKTHDAAVFLINLRYAKTPTKSYYWGTSSGGRSGLRQLQRYPQDYDGAVVASPNVITAENYLAYGKITRALAAPGGYLNQAKRAVIYDAAIAACDGLDGLKDGIISNVAACNAIFDPVTATVDGTAAGKPVRCVGGADTGDTCLSDVQINVMKTINTPFKFTYPLASGQTSFLGFNTWGTDFGATADAGILTQGFNTAPPGNPATSAMPFATIFYDQWVRYVVTKDANFNALTLDPENPGKWASRISDLSLQQDALNPDLSEFRARGGKLLMIHGTSDPAVSNRGTDAYFESVKAKMGTEAVASFARYWHVPGFSHTIGRAFNLRWDPVTMLENWSEKGIAPNSEVVSEAAAPNRTRPLCEYPSWPKYNGSGDANLAASFTCATQFIR